MKLELKHIAPYLSFGLKCQIADEFDKITNEANVFEIIGASTHSIQCDCGKTTTNQFHYEDVLPILAPMSDLSKKDIRDYIVCNDVIDLSNNRHGFLSIQEDLKEFTFIELFRNLDFFYRNHFDVFGLIDKKLAIDKTKLPTSSFNGA